MFQLRNEGQSAKDIHAWLQESRAVQGVPAPNNTNVRKAVQGQSYRRGAVETRRRRRKLFRRAVQRFVRTRQELTVACDNEGQAP